MDALDMTVVLPVCEEPEALPMCLAHLEQQSYPAAAFEVLVVDGTGTGAAADVVERFSAGAPVRIRYEGAQQPGMCAAWNHGLRAARGQRVLFLSIDVLASPRLIERHMDMHRENAMPLCAPGAIAPHPQLPAGAITPWFLPESQCASLETGFDLLDCSAAHLSLPRKEALDAGGFAAGFPPGEFCDAELAWRLSRQRVLVRPASGALVYAWRPSPFDRECSRQYRRGYALFQFVACTGQGHLAKRFHLGRRIYQYYFLKPIIPVYLEVCRQSEENSASMGTIYRRVLRYYFAKGYLEARRGKPAQPPGETMTSAPIR